MVQDLQKQLKSELHEELEGNILPWWTGHMIDDVNGGFLGHVDFNGKPDPEASKGAILNSRILWTFSSAYNALGMNHYLDLAARAYHYYIGHFIDREHGGVFWALDHTGKPLHTKKQTYAIAFAIYALTEYYQARQAEDSLELAKALFMDIEARCFDTERNGYFEAFSRDWKQIDDLRLSEKDQNDSKTMNTHLHILEAYTKLFSVWKDRGLEWQLHNLVQLFLDRFVDEDGHLRLFFDDDWNLKSDFISFGHDIECSWLLHEAGTLVGDAELEERTESVAVRMADANLRGMDDDGGLFYEYFPAQDRYDTHKHWWPQAEAIVGHFNAFELSGDEKYLLTAMNSWEFIKRHIIDRKNGEWHWSVDKSGKPNPGEEKAGFWKCPYHNSRACLEIMKRVP